MMHIFISNLTIIGSDNGLSPGRRQAIIWTNTGILLMNAPTTFEWVMILIPTKVWLILEVLRYDVFTSNENYLKNNNLT